MHVGVILDGNRRWAKDRGLSVAEGHSAGFNNLFTIARHAYANGVTQLSAFCFSTENWGRNVQEVADIFATIGYWLTQHSQLLEQLNVRVVHTGNATQLPATLNGILAGLQSKTANNGPYVLNLCINYGGLWAIQNGVRFKPDLDLVIRTGGQQRLSNFMLQEAAYAELYFEPLYWPDLTPGQFNNILKWYTRQQRRHGK